MTAKSQALNRLLSAGRDLAASVNTRQDAYGLIPSELALFIVAEFEYSKYVKTQLDLPSPDNPTLTRRERAVVELIKSGHKYKEAAKILNMALGTLKCHLKNARNKAA